MAALAINLLTFFLLCLICFSLTEAQKGGFSVELIHRDSPKSPFYNPLETPYQRVTKALRSSINNLHRFDRTYVSPNTATADIIPNSGSYLMKISIGTPPTAILGVADTGSDLVWTQCEPCRNCYKQTAPLFKPSSSSTYRNVACPSSQCSTFHRTSCSAGTCMYSETYDDQSYTKGNLAVDTVTLSSTAGGPVAIPKVIFGCGLDNNGTFNNKTAGIVGLGGGDVSLITQMGSITDGKFSYCLIPFGSTTAKTSKLNFGSAAVVSGTGVVSTPLVSRDPKTFYFLTLESISVANKEIPFGFSLFGPSEGNIIIDSGTTLTILPEDYTSELLSAISDAIDAKPVSDPSGLMLDLCYEATSDFKVPDVTVRFKGADVKLDAMHLFIAVSEDVLCCTFVGSQTLTIYGNLHQANFLVGYDTKEGSVSFKPTDCTKQ